MSKKVVGEMLGKQIGVMEGVDEGSNGDCNDCYLRLRVSIDIIKPLRRRIKLIICSSNDPIWIPLRYKKLWDFCYYCVRVDHIIKDCLSRFKVKETNNVSVYQYGPWLGVA